MERAFIWKMKASNPVPKLKIVASGKCAAKSAPQKDGAPFFRRGVLVQQLVTVRSVSYVRTSDAKKFHRKHLVWPEPIVATDKAV